MTYWKQHERDIAKWWLQRGFKSKRVLFHTGLREGKHADVIVQITPELQLHIDSKSTKSNRGKHSISIKKEDCLKLQGPEQIIQFSYYQSKDYFIILRAEDYLELIKCYLRRGIDGQD